MIRRPLARHAAQSLAFTAIAASGLGWLLGAPGLVIAALLSVLWLAWRFDNGTGSCLMLTVLLLIVVAIPPLLLALMALDR